MKKTPGQIAFETFFKGNHSLKWDESTDKKHWEKTAQAVLDSQWRSVDDPPENPEELVLVYSDENPIKVYAVNFEHRNNSRTHWMPIPNFPKSKDRKEFKEWAKKYFTNTEEKRRQDIAWQAWQAARAIK